MNSEVDTNIIKLLIKAILFTVLYWDKDSICIRDREKVANKIKAYQKK